MGTRHLTPAQVKTPHLGNPKKKSKAARVKAEYIRLFLKFGEHSAQVTWFLKSRPGFVPPAVKRKKKK